MTSGAVAEGTGKLACMSENFLRKIIDGRGEILTTEFRKDGWTEQSTI